MKRVNQHLYVAPQPSDADLEKAARAGVRLVVNNRPDGEEAGSRARRSSVRGLGRSEWTMSISP